MRHLLFGLFILSTAVAFSKGPILSAKDLESPPPRIIRTCCSFGSDVKVMVIPGLKVTDITSIEQLGTHHYLGAPEEGNGIIYTRKGGFIDIGHLRDIADWTAYLYSKILMSQQNGETELKLGHEGGLKTLSLYLPAKLDSLDAAILAGRIAYDLSVWHEIATWFGASTVPLFPERYSSFSIEDAYSNLFGATLGIEALKSELPYEEAMTKLISEILKKLKAVDSETETYAAMEAVRDIWWTRDKKLPSRKVLLQRQLNVYPIVEPLLVAQPDDGHFSTHKLVVPFHTADGSLLTELYTLKFKLNLKFPHKKLFPERKTRDITQNDFQTLLDYIRQDLERPKYQLKDKL
jgi:Protein of unknown function (DUF4056)